VVLFENNLTNLLGEYSIFLYGILNLISTPNIKKKVQQLLERTTDFVLDDFPNSNPRKYEISIKR
jgi:hypothetical protein